MKQTVLLLSKLPEGERGYVSSVDRELRDTTDRLGLIPGTEILCLRRSPLGSPIAYWFRSTVLALRESTAAGIRIVQCSEETNRVKKD